MYSVIKENDKYIGILSSNDNHLNKLEIEMLNYARRKLSNIKQRARRSNFENIKFTNIEFLEWIMNQDNYESLYLNYINNNKDVNFAPSVDRHDDYETYSIDNIRLTTWKENKDKYNSDRIIGKNTKQSKPVIGVKVDGEKIRFHSSHYASQQTGVVRSSINRSCHTNRKFKKLKSRSGEYYWIFEEDKYRIEKWIFKL